MLLLLEKKGEIMAKKKAREKNISQKFHEKYFDNYSKRNMTIYLVLRALVILTLIRQIFMGNWNNVFLCALTLVLFVIPAVIEKKLNLALPDALQIIILLFIYSAEILGEINEFYIVIPHWDTILHTLNGFLCAAVGFSMIDILNQKEFFHAMMSPLFVALVAFCFSMTIGVMWEFFEFGMDQTFRMDMQKDDVIRTVSTINFDPEGKNKPVIVDNIQKTIIQNIDKDGNVVETVIDGGYLDLGVIDTMQDLMVNFVGAIVFSIIGCLYIKNRDGYKFAENFIPVMRKSKKVADENN